MTADRPDAPPLSHLQSLGWQPFFADQTTPDEITQTPPVRVSQVHRAALHVLGEDLATRLPPRADVTVGDWLLYDADVPANSRLLERKSLIKRRAPGHDRQVQLIAANIDTCFIVSSCNPDFNIARLERYIALALDAGVDPVVVLTKSDTSDDPESYAVQARAISDRMEVAVPVVVLNARSDAVTTDLAPWCGAGQTIAFLGSSGVGKSTLVNSLSGQSILTQDIREDDARGRHTTTHRHLHLLASGCAVIDTPGMRELQLTDAASGVSELFVDFEEIAAGCRFNDCKHDVEPGCAVQAAVASGTIDAARLARWRKLVAEDTHNSATLAQRRSKDKTFGKMVRQSQKDRRK